MSTPNPAATPAPRPGAEPRGLASSRIVAFLLGLASLAGAGVVGRDLWFRFGAKDPTNSWIGGAFRWVSELPANRAAVAAGVALSLVGLFLVVSALAPRPRTHVRFNSDTSIWLRPVDVARMATFTAREHAAHNIRSQATRSRLRVVAQDDGRGEALRSELTEALHDKLAGMSRPLRVDVRLTTPTTEGQS